MTETTERKPWEIEHDDRARKIDNLLHALGLTVTSEFVPWSKSRNAKPNPKTTDYGLNWRVTLNRDGREIVTTGLRGRHCALPGTQEGRAARHDQRLPS